MILTFYLYRLIWGWWMGDRKSRNRKYLCPNRFIRNGSDRKMHAMFGLIILPLNPKYNGLPTRASAHPAGPRLEIRL